MLCSVQNISFLSPYGLTPARRKAKLPHNLWSASEAAFLARPVKVTKLLTAIYPSIYPSIQSNSLSQHFYERKQELFSNDIKCGDEFVCCGKKSTILKAVATAFWSWGANYHFLRSDFFCGKHFIVARRVSCNFIHFFDQKLKFKSKMYSCFLRNLFFFASVIYL